MKFFIAFFLVAASIAQCLSASLQGQLLDNQQGLNENLEALRVRKSAYGAPAPAPSYAPAPAPSYAPAPAPSYSAPPCPTNYLFSCGPQVSPVPCSSSSGGYQGSYSENIPQYLAPQFMAPRQYAYPQYAFPVITEV